MILADTSVWLDHFAKTSAIFSALLDDRNIAMHPYVLGEIAMGNLRGRNAVLADLQLLPPIAAATHTEVLSFVESNRLYGTGVGFVDCHLLASARLSGIRLWTFDKRLAAAASKLGLAA